MDSVSPVLETSTLATYIDHLIHLFTNNSAQQPTRHTETVNGRKTRSETRRTRNSHSETRWARPIGSLHASRQRGYIDSAQFNLTQATRCPQNAASDSAKKRITAMLKNITLVSLRAKGIETTPTVGISPKLGHLIYIYSAAKGRK